VRLRLTERASQIPWSGSAPHLGLRIRPGLYDAAQSRQRQSARSAAVQQDRVERGAEDVVLTLVESDGVADPDGTVPPQLAVISPLWWTRSGSRRQVDPVHDLQRTVRSVFVVFDICDELQ